MQCWQATGFDPAPAHGAACATPGAAATTENGPSAIAAAAVAITLPMPLGPIRDNSRERSNASLLTRGLPASWFAAVMFGDVALRRWERVPSRACSRRDL